MLQLTDKSPSIALHVLCWWCHRPQWLPERLCSTSEPGCDSAPDPLCPRSQTSQWCRPDRQSEWGRQLRRVGQHRSVKWWCISPKSMLLRDCVLIFTKAVVKSLQINSDTDSMSPNKELHWPVYQKKIYLQLFYKSNTFWFHRLIYIYFDSKVSKVDSKVDLKLKFGVFQLLVEQKKHFADITLGSDKTFLTFPRLID